MDDRIQHKDSKRTINDAERIGWVIEENNEGKAKHQPWYRQGNRRQQAKRRGQKTPLGSAFQTIGNDEDKRCPYEGRDKAQLHRKPNGLPAGGIETREIVIIERQGKVIGPEPNEGSPYSDRDNHYQGQGNGKAKQEGR